MRAALAFTLALCGISVFGTVLLAVYYPGNAMSGGGVESSQRPAIFWILAAGGAGGWVVASATLLAWLRGLAAVPAGARGLAASVLGPLFASDEPILRFARDLSPRMRLYLAVRMLLSGIALAVLFFVAPLLLGSLVHPGFFWPSELPAILACAAVVVVWTAVILWRARPKAGSGWGAGRT